MSGRLGTRPVAVTAIVALHLWAAPSSAQSATHARLDSLMTWSSQIGVFNGNVLVMQGGKTEYAVSFGYADATRTRRLTLDHRFNIGSIT